MMSWDSVKGCGLSYTNLVFKFELKRRNIFVSKTILPGWDRMSQFVNRGLEQLSTPAQIHEVQDLLLDASNEATVVAEVMKTRTEKYH